MSGSPLDGRRQSRLANLPRRIYLTYRYRGFRAVLYQSLVFPLRLTPLDRFLPLGPGPGRRSLEARRWYRGHGRPVTIVIPSYRDARLVTTLVAKIRQTTPRERVRIVIADDASGPEHVAALRRLTGVELVLGDHNAGFSTNVNRGLAHTDPGDDVVLLNSDVVPLRGWLAALQYALEHRPRAGIVGAKLLYPDNRIQYAGTIRNPQDPAWFDHRFRFRPSDWGPADVPGPTLAATGACMYIRREVGAAIGGFDEAYPIGFEDVDYCLRAWQAGYEVLYAPDAQLHHLESATRGTTQGDRELASQRIFWQRWGQFFDGREATDADGHLRIVYVTEDTVVGGGHRVVFEHLNGLVDRGHDAELWTLGDTPGWFDLRCPIRRFDDMASLEAALEPLDALKVATWWRTAIPVWRASVRHGIPVYLVQDIETSYYADDPQGRFAVLDSYRPEFRFLTTSAWNRSHLEQLGLTARVVTPGVDLGTFASLRGTERREDMLLALGRTDPLKNLALTLAAWRALGASRPELCLFGSEPELCGEPGIRYVTRPSDAEVNRLLNQAGVFVQTSRHEGFCLPLLEAMATGAPAVCTDAHGNRDFCVDGENCLIVAAEPEAVAGAIQRLLDDPPLRERLGRSGQATARRYGWPERIEELEAVLQTFGRPATGPRPPAEQAG